MESELHAARQELVGLRQELVKSRHDSEEARGTTASLQAQLASKQQVEDYLRETAAGAQRHQQQLEEAKLRLATLEVERTNLSERVAEMRASLTRAEGNVQQLVEKFISGAPHTLENAGTKT